MRCLSTRTTVEGFKRRRYESAIGHRHTTIEVPLEVWNRVNTVGRQRNRAAEAMRALNRESLQRQAVMLASTSGLSTREVAARLGTSESNVRRWKAQHHVK